MNVCSVFFMQICNLYTITEHSTLTDDNKLYVNVKVHKFSHYMELDYYVSKYTNDNL